jgi:hypothetical protein
VIPFLILFILFILFILSKAVSPRTQASAEKIFAGLRDSNGAHCKKGQEEAKKPPGPGSDVRLSAAEREPKSPLHAVLHAVFLHWPPRLDMLL